MFYCLEWKKKAIAMFRNLSMWLHNLYLKKNHNWLTEKNKMQVYVEYIFLKSICKHSFKGCCGRKGLLSQEQLSNSHAQSPQEILLVIFVIFCMKIPNTYQCLWFSTWSSRLSCVHMALSEVRSVNINPSVLKVWHWHPTWSLRSGFKRNIHMHHVVLAAGQGHVTHVLLAAGGLAWSGSKHPKPQCFELT